MGEVFHTVVLLALAKLRMVLFSARFLLCYHIPRRHYADPSRLSGLRVICYICVVQVLVCAFLVFFMQTGFALLESGTIRQKNVKNILLKNGADA